MTLRLITLGGLSGSAGGAPIDWLGSKWLQTGLLTYVTLERSPTRETLLGLFWPESDSDSAGHRLNQAIYALRRSIGDGCIESRRHDLRATSALGADALDFEAAIRDGQHQRAIDLYRGPFLAGVHLVNTPGFENWIDARRARHAREFRTACRTLVDRHVAAGDISTALAAARAWIVPDPVDDEAQHRLIELLALTGQRTQALKQYALYVRLLEADDLEPLDQTRELARSLESTTTTGATHAFGRTSVVAGAASTDAPMSSKRTAVHHPIVDPAPLVDEPGRAAPISRPARWGWMGSVGLLVAVGAWVLFSPRLSRAAPRQTVGLGILIGEVVPDEATSLANAVVSSLSGHLAEYPALRVVPSGRIGSLRATGIPSDSLAIELRLDYIVETTMQQSGDTVALTLSPLLGGLRLVRNVRLRVRMPTILAADSIGRLAADSLRYILGDHIEEQRLTRGTRDSLALRHFYSARRRLVRASAALRDGAPDRTIAYLSEADSILELSHARDPEWSLPLIQRGSNTELLVFALSLSGMPDSDIVDALDEAIEQLDDVIERRREPTLALAWRGRLRRMRMSFADFSEAAIESALSDLDTALDHDAPAWAAVEVSRIQFEERQSFNTALSAARDALARDVYLDDYAAILERMGLSHFELMREDSASWWCGGAAKLSPRNPAPVDCLLQILAWGSGTADPDSAWTLYAAIVERLMPGNNSMQRYAGMAVAGVLARAGLRDSALAVLYRSRYPDEKDAPALLASEAAVWFRLGEPDSARRRLDTFRDLDPAGLRALARRRMLHEFLSAEPVPGND